MGPRIFDEWPRVYSLNTGYCLSSIGNSSAISKWRFINFPVMSVFVLGVLTFLRDFLSPVDSLAKLLAPCIAWAIIFLASAIGVPLQIWRRKAEGLELTTARWIDRGEVNVALCLFLVHLCSASANGFGGSLWPYVCTLEALLIHRHYYL